jgi:hypothetical protein
MAITISGSGIVEANLADNAVTLAKMASGTDGEILTYDASGNPTSVSVGTDGQVLTSTGVGSSPAFEDAGGGGAWTLIGTTVASTSASLDITGLDSTYDTYAIAISDMLPSTDSADVFLRMGDSGGIDSGSTDYAYHVADVKTGTSTYQAGAFGSDTGGTTAIKFDVDGWGVGNASGSGFGAMLYLHRPADGTMHPSVSGTYSAKQNSGNTYHGGFMVGFRKAVITLDRVQVLFSTGNITSGRMTIWGISHD